MKVFDFPQLSEEWWTIRRGVPTASNFGRIITPIKGKYASAARSYMYELIAELANPLKPWEGQQSQPFRSTAMQYGTDTEPEARRAYSMLTDRDVREVGFCLTDCGRFGASPDGLVGDDGALELKCPDLKTQVEYLDKGALPPEYVGQVHGQLLVTGRQWIDFMSYAPGLPAFLISVEPNEITKALADCLEQFAEEYSAMRAKFGL